MQVWLRQTGFRFGSTSFDGHCAALFMVFLCNTKVVSGQMPPLNIFQAFLKFFIDTSLLRTTLLASGETRARPVTSSPQQAAELLFPLGPVAYNALWRVSQSSALQLADEAKRALALLQHANFASVFLQDRNFFEQFDVFLHIPLAEVAVATTSDSVDGQVSVSHQRKVNYEVKQCLNAKQASWALLSEFVADLLQEGLTDRVTAVRVYPCPFLPFASGGGNMYVN